MIETIKELIKETLNKSDLQIQEDSHLMEDLGIDSLQLIDLMLAVEEEFDVEIDFDNFDMKHFHSLTAFTSYISTLQSE